MGGKRFYIAEIPQVLCDITTIYLKTYGVPARLFAIVEIFNGNVSIVDNCYWSAGEAQSAWPVAIKPKPYHLTSGAVAQNWTVAVRIQNPKLSSR